jgi:hypothetical protein
MILHMNLSVTQMIHESLEPKIIETIYNEYINAFWDLKANLLYAKERCRLPAAPPAAGRFPPRYYTVLCTTYYRCRPITLHPEQLRPSEPCPRPKTRRVASASPAT